MSTLQHINSVIDYNWPEYQRRFPAFNRPEIVPAETLRGMAPAYMRRNIDQDPTSFYMFVKADPLNGDCSREAFKEFIDDLFYEKLEAPSSYDRDAGQGGTLTREQAIDKEVLPAARDAEYQRYYDQQMAAAEAKRAEEEKKARADKLGFDPDDPDIIDIGDDGEVAAPGSRAVGQAQTTAVAMPKQIWYAIDFHCPADRMLGYSGGGRLDGRRGSGRYLREAEGTSSDKADIKAVFKWAKNQGLCDGVIQVAKAKSSASGQSMDLFTKYNLYIFKYADGTYTWVDQSLGTMKLTAALRHMSQKTAGAMAKRYKVGKLVVMTSDELNSEVSESRHEMKLRHDRMLAEAKHRTVVESVCKQLFECMPLNESAEDKELEKELKEKLAEIKTPEDLKKFMEENADQIKDSYKKADKKTKPFYKKAWDQLCSATEKTAGFLLDHIGGVLTLAGILLVGHKIGWKNIYNFIKTTLTGHDPEEAAHTKQTMSKINDVQTQSMKAVGMVDDAVKKGTLTKEQAQKIWSIRQMLPDEVNADADSSGGIVDWVVAMVNPDKALRMTASRAKEIQDLSDVTFMAGLGEVMKKYPGDGKKVDEYLDLFGPGKILGNNLKKASFVIPGAGGWKY